MLYLCPTPIGNLDDITIRTIKVLESVDLVACEDTRISGNLLKHLNIEKPLISYHKFNEKAVLPKILEHLKNGKTIAYVSDAGMPGISDPGRELINACRENGYMTTVLPGPSASITALVMSGLDNERFTFLGFLPEKHGRRTKYLEEIKSIDNTLIFYESPHRIIETLEDIEKVLGNRKIAICREISKVFEEVIVDNVENIVNNIENLTIKGEFVLVVEGGQKESVDIDIELELTSLIDSGKSKRDAVQILCETYNLNRNEVYKISLKL